MSTTPIGISGLAVHVPPFRVDLRDWCEWTGANPAKIIDVVGTGFRLPGPQQSVYTMAANAILRLINQYDIDPAEVRYLALGTESSTDNSAGAVIAKGMVDDALRQQGRNPISRNCEVPEFKHACLGGVYALKNAIRFLNTDGANSKAIVVCSDIALYELGSSGEPTQGAGAVAILLEPNPKLATINLAHAGTASDYRGVDFRKPIQQQNVDDQTSANGNMPVFNGRYSAACYIDEMLHALENMCSHRDLSVNEYLSVVDAVFMHRPFRRMPENGWAIAHLFSLAADETGHEQLREYCRAADIDIKDVINEALERPKVTAFGVPERIQEEAFPAASAVLRQWRKSPAYAQWVTSKMKLGAQQMEELGNLYTGALPAWLAAGFEEAAHQGADLTDKEILLVGYGSGDAAEAIPITPVAGWEEAARKIHMAAAMENSITLNHEQYLAFRSGASVVPAQYAPVAEFVIDRIGSATGEDFQDAGIEYYRYIN